MVRRDRTPPRGPVRLTNENIQLDTTWETAIGDDTNYPGTVPLSCSGIGLLKKTNWEFLSDKYLLTFL